MAPLVPVFPVTSLPDRVNIVSKNFQEKRRKGPAVELEKCQLMEMVQYACNLSVTGQPVCTPVVRLFRRCAGGLTVETTAWERPGRADAGGKQSSSGENKTDTTTATTTTP